MAEAATLISISPFLGVGTSRVTIFMTYSINFHVAFPTSGPPNSVISTHFMVLGMEEKQRTISIVLCTIYHNILKGVDLRMI